MGGVKVYSGTTYIQGGSWKNSHHTSVSQDGITIFFYNNDGTEQNIHIYEGDGESGQHFTVESGYFIVSSSKGTIPYIYMSFTNGLAARKSTGAKNISVPSGNWSKGGYKDNANGHWSTSSSWGETSVRFNVSKQTRILWLRVYYGDDGVISIGGNGTNGSGPTNGIYRYGGVDEDGGTIQASATITSSKGGTIYYTTDGTDPTTSGSRKTYSSAVPITTSTKVKAMAVYSQGGDNGNKTVATKVGELTFTRFYRRNISSYKYTTLCFPVALKVPSTCTWAAACTYDKTNARVTIPSKDSQGQDLQGRYANGGKYPIIPANIPVLVYASGATDKDAAREFDWINTANGESPSASPSSNNLKGNSTGKDTTPSSTSGYKYFGLMAPTTAQKNRGLSFGFYQFSYDGTFGNVKIPAYRAYLEILSSNVKANAAKEGISFGFFDDDENNTTGISVVPKANESVRRSAVRYNLSGQQVGPGYKGIVIVNGRKMVVK